MYRVGKWNWCPNAAHFGGEMALQEEDVMYYGHRIPVLKLCEGQTIFGREEQNPNWIPNGESVGTSRGIKKVSGVTQVINNGDPALSE